MAAPSSTRILFVARELRAAPYDGAGLRRRHLLEVLSGLGPTAAFGLADGPSPLPVLAAWATASDPAAARTPEGPAVLEALKAGRSPLAVVESPATNDELVAFVRDVAPDVVVISGGDLFAYVEVLRPVAPRLVFDLDFVQVRGFGDMAASDPHRARGMLWRHVLHNVVADDERDALTAVDQVWVSNEGERERVHAAVGTDDVSIAVVPNVIDVDSYPRAERRDAGALVYPARFDYWPNEEAARLLVDDVLPHLTDATLTLVGLAPPDWLRERDGERVHVTGAVPDIRPHLAAAAVMPVPLHAGAGTRLKVLEAFAVGLPVVSTAKGVEGLALDAGVQHVRAETAAEFVAAVERLRADHDLADHLITNAREWVQRHGSVETLHDAVVRALAEI